MTARLPDWRPRLAAYLDGVARAPFAHGRHDCALFAAGAVAAMTGTDPAAAWRGQYATEAEGLALLLAEGIAGHVAAVDALFPRVPASFGQVGDLALVNGDHGPGLGVVQGEWIYVVTPRGLGRVGLLEAVTAWRV